MKRIAGIVINGVASVLSAGIGGLLGVIAFKQEVWPLLALAPACGFVAYRFGEEALMWLHDKE